MKHLLVVILFGSCLFFFRCDSQPKELSKQDDVKGTLFIIGGGDHDDTLMQQLINVSGWKKGDLITAISLPSTYDSSFFYINEQLQHMTSQRCVNFDSAAIHDEKKLDSLSRSKIIFIGGGDQSRMMQLIAGSEVKKIIQQAYHDGATIGGTSAGAAVMSRLMITGNQLMDTAYASTFPVLLDSNIELKEGLDLLDSVIIDMHFIARSRYNRLFSAILAHPNYQCIGIDEATAIIVKHATATVAGTSQVMLIETPDNIRKGPHHLIGAADIDVSVYLPGETFKMKH